MNFSDYSENKLVDMLRGQAWTHSTNFYVGLASAAADGSFTELTGTGYARVSVARSLAAWAGTQGAGTSLASSGTSHATSNNAAVNFGTAGSAWGTAATVVLFDASTGGNQIARRALPTPQVINSGDPVSFAAGALAFVVGIAGGCSNYLSNKLVDFIFRAQAFAFPSSLYVGIYTVAPTNAGGGTEVAGAGYARVALAASLTALSGTQGAGSTIASTGTSGRTGNNAALVFPVPTASWGSATAVGIFDAATGGNLLFWAPLTAPKTINSGTAPSFDPDALSITFA